MFGMVLSKEPKDDTKYASFSFPGNVVLYNSTDAGLHVPADHTLYARYYVTFYVPCDQLVVRKGSTITIIGYHSVMRARRVISSHLFELGNGDSEEIYRQVHVYHYSTKTARELSCDRMEVMHDYKVPNSTHLCWRILPYPLDLEFIPKH
jgi:hypothetical protein